MALVSDVYWLVRFFLARELVYEGQRSWVSPAIFTRRAVMNTACSL